MAFKESFESNTVRVKLLYNKNYQLEKIKLRLRHAGATREDLKNCFLFLQKNNIILDKRHKLGWTIEQIEKYIGVIGEVHISDNVKLVITDCPNIEEISIDHLGLVTKDFLNEEGPNHMIDFLVVFYNYYKQ